MEFNGNFSDEEARNAARLRNSSIHPAEFEYGMGDTIPNVQGFDDFGTPGTAGGFGNDFGNSLDNGFGNDFENDFGGDFGGGFGNGPMGDSMGGLGLGGGNGFSGGLPPVTPFGGMQGGMHDTQQPEKKDIDEQVADASIKAAKESWTFLKDCVGAYKHMKYSDFMSAGKECVITGGVLAIIGLVIGLLGVRAGWSMLLGAVIAIPFGLATFFIANSKEQRNAESVENMHNATATVDSYSTDYEDEEEFSPIGEFENIDGEAYETETSDAFDTLDTTSSTTGVGGFGGFGEDEDELETTAPPAGFSFTDIDDDPDEPDINMTAQSVSDAIIDNINVNRSIVTRQYLYDCFVPMLETVKPDFAAETILSENTQEFENWVAAVHFAVEAMRTNDQAEEPQLLRVKQKLYYVVLEIQRVSWLKNLEKFAEEIVNTVSYDATTNKSNPDVYAEATAAGKTIYVKVMTGTTEAFVSVRDIYNAQKDFVCDPENAMPVAVGLDINGNPVMQDMKKIESMLAAGQPRSGKSWFLKTLIAQMMMFNSPKDLNFYFCDPKDKISDFIDIRTPHVRKFTADDRSIIETVEYLAHVEGSRRQEIFSKAGVKSIWDYRQKCPDEDMPLIYLVIDEIITLTSRMEQEERKTFEKLLLEYITRLPAYGIRIWIVPHMVKNNVLSKNVTDMVQWRCCLRFSNAEVCKVLDVKSFPYKLPAKGDMAMRTPDGNVGFAHSAVLATSNDGYAQMFDSIARVWHKIDDRFVTDIEIVHTADEAPKTNAVAKRPVTRKKPVDTRNLSINDTTASHNTNIDDTVIW